MPMENLPSRRDTSTPEKRLAWQMFDRLFPEEPETETEEPEGDDR